MRVGRQIRQPGPPARVGPFDGGGHLGHPITASTAQLRRFGVFNATPPPPPLPPPPDTIDIKHATKSLTN